MSIEPVPDDQRGCADLATEEAQDRDHCLTRDTGAEVAGIQPAIRRDSDYARHLASLAHPPQQRGQPAPCPGRARPDPEAVAGLVPEDEGPLLPARLFLRATQSRLGQTAMTSSSRSLARVAGRCTLKPCALSGRSR